jgi:HSP20 family protein
MAEATKLPIKTDKKAATPAPIGHWTPFESLRREVDRLFDSFHEGAWRHPFGRPVFDLDLSWPREMGGVIAPAVDVAEKEKEYEITAELPGMDEKDIEIKLSNGTLTIKGEKEEKKEGLLPL